MVVVVGGGGDGVGVGVGSGSTVGEVGPEVKVSSSPFPGKGEVPPGLWGARIAIPRRATREWTVGSLEFPEEKAAKECDTNNNNKRIVRTRPALATGMLRIVGDGRGGRERRGDSTRKGTRWMSFTVKKRGGESRTSDPYMHLSYRLMRPFFSLPLIFPSISSASSPTKSSLFIVLRVSASSASS